jgi:acetate kinase
MKILVANIGSTTYKYRLMETSVDQNLAQGKAERIGTPGSQFTDYNAAIEFSLRELVGDGKSLKTLTELNAIAFKTVHGGPCSGARLVDDVVLQALEEFTFYAPAHNIPYLAAMRAFAKIVPSVPLVAVFETAFFANMDEAAVTYAVPYEWKQDFGIRRYGFHGASHRAASERVASLLNKPKLRHISCHLGGSSSLAAIRGGVAIDTSFGISPQSGLPQNNRVGDIDVFAILAMMKNLSLAPDQMATVLSTKSGLAGISGISGDVRDLMQSASTGDVRSQLAMDVYVRSVRNYIAQFYVALGGLDVLSFTGGIGENSVELRSRICDGLDILGINLDPTANASASGEAWIEKPNSGVRILVFPADEERIVARATAELISGHNS